MIPPSDPAPLFKGRRRLTIKSVVQSSQNASLNVILAPGVLVVFVPGLKEGLTYYIAGLDVVGQAK